MPEYGSEYENEGYKEKVKEKTTPLGEKVDSFNEKNENLDNKSSHDATREERTDNSIEKDQDYKNFDPKVDDSDELDEEVFDPNVEDDELEEEVFDPIESEEAPFHKIEDLESDIIMEEEFTNSDIAIFYEDSNKKLDDFKDSKDQSENKILDEDLLDQKEDNFKHHVEDDQHDNNKKEHGDTENKNDTRLNQEYARESNREQKNSIHNYNHLSDEKVQDIFRRYHDETGKYPNYSKNLRKDFIDWVKKTEKIPEIINKFENIQDNQEITNYIKDKIKNTNLSQTDIVSLLREKYLSLSRKTIGTVSLKDVFNNNRLSHHQRFDISLEPKIKGDILKRIREEIEKYNSGAPHSSLYKIAKEYPQLSKTTIDKIARKEIPQDLYKKIWPSTVGRISQERKTEIRNVIKKEFKKENPRSLRSIAEDFHEISHSYAMELAKKMYPNRYRELWPANEKIPVEIKKEIIRVIRNEVLQDNPRTLKEIHNQFKTVGADSIKRLAKKSVPQEIHDNIWKPLTTEISQEIKTEIIKTLKSEIKKPIPHSLYEIGKIYNVSAEFTRKLAKKTISKEIYEETWKSHAPINDDVKKKIINDITNTNLNITEIAEKFRVSHTSVSSISQNKVFKGNLYDHKNRFPSDKLLEIGTYTPLNLNSLLTKVLDCIPEQKYYTEPKIYPDKRRPDGLILEDNNFLHQRLSNPQTGEYLRAKLKLDPNRLDHIKSTQFDFTNDISNENLINKIEKYQSDDSLLVIIGTRWYLYDDIKSLPLDDRIKHIENVRVISHDLAEIFIGLKGNFKDQYDRIISFDYNHDLKALRALYNYDLSFVENHNTEELNRDLVQKGLIEKDFDEFFSFDLINTKKAKGKQTDLDYFLNG
ncbi:MAG: hypothetical protein ACXAAI_02195 [Promethearchaeota archaeon]